MKLLIVEDNSRLADRMQRYLGKLYTIDAVRTGAEAIEKAQMVDYGVILLDIGLPDMSGEVVCKTLRDINIHTPILILTGVNDKETRVATLHGGADDYVTKPFDSEELLARIAALARRRSRHIPRPTLTYRDLVINSDQRTVERAGIPIDLRRKEFDILEYMILNKGRVLTRDMIMNQAWDAAKISWSSTVDVHIKHLRDKVDKPFSGPTIIKTAYGLGYQVEDNDEPGH